MLQGARIFAARDKRCFFFEWVLNGLGSGEGLKLFSRTFIEFFNHEMAVSSAFLIEKCA